ncbi:glycerol-3-phosphate 1-O-acyltransferase PlsY [Paenibacillus yanchengensis]|uniref:Glycerol-3-phosphate acyltransferase n=1 Tax=Paenibacillus yanchengensis TaxID=2035833 RepID=A0ABW4YK34_9BACL
MLYNIIAIIASYLLGSISFSIVYARLFKGIDIRQHGSGNAGATNTLRILGKGPGILVFLLDFAKGTVAVLLGYWLSTNEWVPVLCGLAAIIGHNWPIWFRFKGGKGIATTVGAMAALAFWPALIAGILTIILIAITKYVSVGSLLFATLTPIFVAIFNFSWPLFGGTLIICLFAFVRHRSNIVKLLQGKENKLGTKKGM